MDINRFLINLCSQDLAASRAFYTSLFAFEVDFDSDWFIHLLSNKNKFELGLILDGHAVVPAGVACGQQANYLTFVVDDVEQVHSQAVEKGYDIQEAPTDTEYGQRRMILIAPEGTICDVSSLISN